MHLSFQRVWMEHIGFGFSLYLARFCSCFRSQHPDVDVFASFAFLLDLWPTLSPTCNFLFRLKIRLLPAAASAVLFAVLCRIVRKCAALENYFYFCVYAISQAAPRFSLDNPYSRPSWRLLWGFAFAFSHIFVSPWVSGLSVSGDRLRCPLESLLLFCMSLPLECAWIPLISEANRTTEE